MRPADGGRKRACTAQDGREEKAGTENKEPRERKGDGGAPWGQGRSGGRRIRTPIAVRHVRKHDPPRLWVGAHRGIGKKDKVEESAFAWGEEAPCGMARRTKA